MTTHEVAGRTAIDSGSYALTVPAAGRPLPPRGSASS
jgi:hypothetical protein